MGLNVGCLAPSCDDYKYTYTCVLLSIKVEQEILGSRSRTFALCRTIVWIENYWQ